MQRQDVEESRIVLECFKNNHQRWISIDFNFVDIGRADPIKIVTPLEGQNEKPLDQLPTEGSQLVRLLNDEVRGFTEFNVRVYGIAGTIGPAFTFEEVFFKAARVLQTAYPGANLYGTVLEEEPRQPLKLGPAPTNS